MITINSADEINLLRESVDLECKLAGGRNGKGRLPEDFWPTYSAFANTYGGVILLGVRETDGVFDLRGLGEPTRVRSDLFNLLNNRQKISTNLLSDAHVQEIVIDGKNILVIEVPRGTRKQKPVHVGMNPMTGTYKRLNDGDRLCDAETVRRMLAEQVEDTRDNKILRGYSFDDLSASSIRVYRQLMRDRTPNHPYLDQELPEFLRLLGAWRRDRETGEEGITAAGLLMFGHFENIRDEFPHYFVDYQERPQARSEPRWVDRVTLDGTWPGNLFEFYRTVYRKLVADIKVPFALSGGQSVGDTPVHTALREALVNSIIHADYAGRASLLVVKRPDMFGFRNPGSMRISVAQALAGGESDGRNRLLQQMFLLIGAGERAGSGVPKIHKGWVEQHWRPPSLYEKQEPSEQTLLELRMIDLIPADAMELLQSQFGERLNSLDHNQRLALATAATERTVTHARMNAICDAHPTDITRMLQGLVQDGLLIQTGRTKGAVYHLPGTALPSPEDTFASPTFAPEGADPYEKGSDLTAKGSDLSSQPSRTHTGKRIEGLRYPLIDALDELEPSLRDELTRLAERARSRRRLPVDEMRATILSLCRGRYLTIKVIARLLNRDEDYLRLRLLNPMVDEGSLIRAFPQAPNDPRQAYSAS